MKKKFQIQMLLIMLPTCNLYFNTCLQSHLIEHNVPVPWERGSFSFQVLSQSFLDLPQEVRQTLQLFLDIRDVDYVHHQWRTCHLLHQSQELCAHSEFKQDFINSTVIKC